MLGKQPGLLPAGGDPGFAVAWPQAAWDFGLPVHGRVRCMEIAARGVSSTAPGRAGCGPRSRFPSLTFDSSIPTGNPRVSQRKRQSPFYRHGHHRRHRIDRYVRSGDAERGFPLRCNAGAGGGVPIPSPPCTGGLLTRLVPPRRCRAGAAAGRAHLPDGLE